MEAIFDFLQSIHLSIIEVMFTLIPIFYVGYRMGGKKVRKVTEEMHSLQRQMLDLNEELLYGKSETPVIGIKHDPIKISNIAK
ncbi:MAG: hypothetical protein JST75_20800 [Bacteroidetes bacterium]|nr:hypothetical protein [Bacteroidota bacterium]